jgi:hypothetical protein
MAETAAAVVGSAVLSKVMAPKPKRSAEMADTSAALAKQEATTKAESDRLKAAGNKSLADQRKRRAATGSLLSGLETGVSADSDKRKVIG